MRIKSFSLALVLAAALPAAAHADPGQTLFQQRCEACHTVTAGQAGVIAPNLRGVVGRKAASSHFAMYSPALKASGVVWSKASLEKFLTNPQAMVPGTRMVISLPDAGQRAAVVEYLAGLN